MWITLHSRVRGGACRGRGGVGTVVDATRASRAPQRAPRKRAHRLLITTESQMFAVGGLSAHELVPAGRQLPIRAGLSRAVRPLVDADVAPAGGGVAHCSSLPIVRAAGGRDAGHDVELGRISQAQADA